MKPKLSAFPLMADYERALGKLASKWIDTFSNLCVCECAWYFALCGCRCVARVGAVGVESIVVSTCVCVATTTAAATVVGWKLLLAKWRYVLAA